MSKKSLYITISYAALLALPLIAIAAVDSIQSLSQAIANFMWYVFGLFVLVCFVIAGILFLTAQGDSSKLQAARSSVYWGLVGIIVGILAYSILGIMGGFLG